jgi:hypothetical protein
MYRLGGVLVRDGESKGGVWDGSLLFLAVGFCVREGLACEVFVCAGAKDAGFVHWVGQLR